MANSIKKYVWNSSTHSNTSDFIAPTPLSGRGSTDIKVKVGSTILTSGYTLTVDSSNVAKVRFQTLPNNGDPIRIYRQTNHTGRLVDFVDGSLLTSETLDLDSNQLFNIAQEAYDKGDEATIGSESFYYSQGDAPENVAVGTLWYDTSSSTNTLQVWSGTEWQATAPAKVKKTYQRVTTNGFLQVANNAHSSGKTKFADTAFKTHSSLYLNGVKLVEASTLANIPSKGDYFLSGGDVILLNLSSDTDVLVSETFDGSFSSSVTASEANAATSAQASEIWAGLSANNYSSAANAKIDAEDAKDDAAKYASHPQDSTFSTHDNSATGQYSARHYALSALDNAVAAQTAATSQNVIVVGTDLVSNTSNIRAVASSIDEVEDVAGIIDDVTSVSNLGTELDTIVNKYDGTTNASGTNKNIAQIDTVADNIGDVNTVAADTSKIDTIASDLDTGASSLIKKVSDSIGSVNAVASLVGTALANGITWLANTTNQNTLGAVEAKIAEIDAVEAKLTQIDTVAGVADEVAVVGESGYKGNVQTVANTDYKAKVTTVASMQDDVNTVASASSDIDTITTGDNLSNIGTVVSNISAVQGASANAATASTGASTATTKANEASVSEANAEAYMNTASGHATTAGTHKTAAQSAQAASEAAQSIAEGASTSASNSKTQAAASEDNAAASAASAQNSASSATASENQAEVYMNASNDWDSFYQKRYLGDASSNPSVDTAGNALENGALYFNTSDNTMYVFNGSTWVAAESTINNVNYGANLAANLNTNNHDISFGANDKAKFGAGNDLQIYHSGTHSFITDSGTGSLFIGGDTETAITNAAGTEYKLRTFSDGSVSLYHDNVTKLATTSTGIDVTGDMTTTGNVGINKTDPKGPLHVYGTNYSYFTSNVANVTPHATTQGLALGWNKSSGAGESVIAYNKGAGSHGGLVFANSNGGTYREDMRIDSSGRVGIGTSSPQSVLHVSASGTSIPAVFSLTATNSGASNSCNSQIKSLESSAGSGSSELSFHTRQVGNAFASPQEAMRIDSSGNVGIGTTSPDRPLDITDSTNDGTGGAVIHSYLPTLELDDISGGGTSFILQHDATNTLFKHGTTERMRIDSSGNVLVGKTSSTFNNTAGIGQFPSGRIYVTRDNGNCLYLNRVTSNGDIAAFYKDGLPVGSIGSVIGQYLRIGSGDVGIMFQSGTDAIEPRTTADANRDGAISLGASPNRFKDLHLSGGVYLGGTGSANKLDDYEEGTFVVNTAGDATGAFNGTPTCYYTKIGNTVSVLISFRVGTNFTSQSIGGLPFSADHANMSSSYIVSGIAVTSNNNTVSTTVGNNGTTIRFHNDQDTGDNHFPNTTGEYYRLNFTYRTTA
jgi:hypothetical protein